MEDSVQEAEGVQGHHGGEINEREPQIVGGASTRSTARTLMPGPPRRIASGAVVRDTRHACPRFRYL